MSVQMLGFAKEITIEQSNNLFAFDVYENYKDNDNVFISPYSLSSALTMTYEGASGATAQEMRAVLHLSGNKDKVRHESLEVYNRLNRPGKLYELNTSNALWLDSNFDIVEDYMSLLTDYYTADVVNLDFVNQAELARLTINKWVEERTNNKIKDLIARGEVTPATKLILTNAIYFKAKWETPFQNDSTKLKPFWVSEDNDIDVQMMHNTDYFKYGENEELKIIELDYQSELSMIIILPKNNVQAIEQQFSLANLAKWKGIMKHETVSLSLPRFKLEGTYDMKDCLMTLGVKNAFYSSSAEFNRISLLKGLFISKVVHRTFIEVAELGTEAAAVTGIYMPYTSDGSSKQELFKEFNANHPFLFIIQEKENGNILFMGKVTSPQPVEDVVSDFVMDDVLDDVFDAKTLKPFKKSVFVPIIIVLLFSILAWVNPKRKVTK